MVSGDVVNEFSGLCRVVYVVAFWVEAVDVYELVRGSYEGGEAKFGGE